MAADRNVTKRNARLAKTEVGADASGAADYVSREWTEERVNERYEWLFRYDVDAVPL